ncbi:MAG: type I-E CRISPR-associated protein Cas7/Cse4/CasC [Clostridia bacterium]
MLFEIHMLKNYPSANLNRDDTGAPKTCYFGGTQRGRISSQCLKHSWRKSPIFQEMGELAFRSRKLPDLVEQELRARGLDEAFVQDAKKKTTGIGNKEGKENSKEPITTQMMFFSHEDVVAVADKLCAMYEEAGSSTNFAKLSAKKLIDEFKNGELRPITLDIALFGRMVTSKAFANVESVLQVAHAVSTHVVNLESDYFTAVDDLMNTIGSDDAGAGMIGEVDYNSCCYYEYVALDTDELKRNLAHSPDALALADQLLPVLLRTMAMSNPSGKQNTFAGHVLPEAICVEAKTCKIPLSYVNAYAEPASRTHIVKDSVEKLSKEIDLMEEAYQLPVAHRAWMSLRHPECHPAKADSFANFAELVDACAKWALE